MVIERSESESSLSVCRFQDIPSTTKSQDAQVSYGGLCIQSSASIDSTKDSSYSTAFIKKKKKFHVRMDCIVHQQKPMLFKGQLYFMTPELAESQSAEPGRERQAKLT